MNATAGMKTRDDEGFETGARAIGQDAGRRWRTTAAEHMDAVTPGEFQKRVDAAGLADSCFAAHHHQRRSAFPGQRKTILQAGQFLHAADQHSRHHTPHSHIVTGVNSRVQPTLWPQRRPFEIATRDNKNA